MFSFITTIFFLFYTPDSTEVNYFYFGNTNLLGVGKIVDDKKEGLWKVYIPDNPFDFPQPSLLKTDQEVFEDNFSQERILFQIQFKSDVPNGFFQENYPSGEIRYLTFLKEGKPHGDFREFYKDGELKAHGTFSEGALDGTWEEFNENGKLIAQGNFKNGRQEGEWVEQLDYMPGFYRKGSYLLGLKEGEWLLTDESGKISQIEIFEDGKLVSVGALKAGDKELKAGNLKKGSGIRVFYDSEGHMVAKGRYSRGIPQGSWYFYFPKSDKVLAEGRLVGSNRVGLWYFYSYDGEIIDQQEYYPNSLNSSPNSQGLTVQDQWSPTSSSDALRSAHQSIFNSRYNMNGIFLRAN